MRGLSLLESASGQGNKYADKVIQNFYSHRGNIKIGSVLGTIRLIGHLSRLIKNRLDEEARQDGNTGLIEKKLRWQIEEKKQSHGLRM